jgi:hypothetical protein
MTPRIAQILFLPLLGCVAGALVLSITVHLGLLTGFQPPAGRLLFDGLTVGTILVILVLIVISNMLPGTFEDKDKWWWFLDFPESPAWMKYMANGFRIYFILNVARAFLVVLLSTETPTISMHDFGTGDPSIASWRGFSSAWMAFYSVGLAFLTSAYRASR